MEKYMMKGFRSQHVKKENCCLIALASVPLVMTLEFNAHPNSADY